MEQPSSDVEALVRSVEDARLADRPLSDQDISKLDMLFASRVTLGALGEESENLRSFAHRIWCACSAEGSHQLPEAKLRHFACELFVTGCADRREQTLDERAMLAAQWSLAGRAWAIAQQPSEAITCLEAAAKPWAERPPGEVIADKDVGAIKLAEATFQAYMWASGVHFHNGSHQDAFDALSKAKDTLSASTGLRDLMLDDFLRTCYEQALLHRKAGNGTFAVELLTLALAAEGCGTCAANRDPGAAATRARLMRQLALCYAAVLDRGLALAHAREAVSLGPQQSVHQVQSLQVLLDLLSSPAQPVGLKAVQRHGIDEVRATAMSIMSNPAASLRECLNACRLLVQKAWPEDDIFACLAQLGTRMQGEIAARNEILLFRIAVAVRSVEDAFKEKEAPASTAAERLMNLISEADKDLACSVQAQRNDKSGEGATCRKAIGNMLWATGSNVLNLGRVDEAQTLLRRAAQFLTENSQLADLWATLGAIQRQAGKNEEANFSAEHALAHDPVHLQATLVALASTAECGKAEAKNIISLIERAQGHPGFLPKHAAFIAQVMLGNPNKELRLSSIETLAKRLLREGTTASEHSSEAEGLCIARELVDSASALPASPAQMARCVDLAADHLSLICGRVANQFLEEVKGQTADALSTHSAVNEVRQILNTAWSHGIELGQQERWADCILIFEALNRLLDLLDSVDTQEVLDVRIWCLILMSSAKVQTIKELDNQAEEHRTLCETVLQRLDRAHQLCRRTAQAPGHRGSVYCEAALAGGVEGQGAGKPFAVLVLLEFEVRCIAGDPEKQLCHFIDEASAQEAVGVKSLLAMSKIAASISHRRLAIHCLQRYLRIVIGSRGTVNYAHCAAAYREMIGLHASRNESFSVYEGVLHLLSGGGTASDSNAGTQFPQDEIAWLISTAWNNGAHFFRLQQYRWSERWMGKSLAFTKFCKGVFPEDKMMKSYTKCLEQCRD